MFAGRQKELNKLESMYREEGFQFAVIYGRRRVGKTTLIAEFAKDKPVISYISIEGTMKENLEGLSRAVLMMYFSREQVKTLLNSLTGSFDRGFLLAELMHPKMMNEKKHDTVKNTNAKFGWGTVTGRDLLPLDAKLTLINERSFWKEMKKYSLIGKIGSVIAGKLNNRLAVYRWQ